MFVRILTFAFLVCLFTQTSVAQPAQRRVALVIGQNAYSALDPLVNPRLDAQRMAKTLAAHGFDVIACDEKTPGCFDLTRDGLTKALATFAAKAKGADLALVHYAGHGLETDAGNIVARTSLNSISMWPCGASS